MQRVVDVEEPLHERIDGGIRSAFSVVQRQDRDGEHDGELHRGVQHVLRHERVREDRHVEDQPQRLPQQVPAVRPEAQHQHGRRAAPVPAIAHEADEADEKRFQPRAPDALRILHAQHRQPPRQRPDHARLAAPSVIKRDVCAPFESVPLERVGEVRDESEKKHAEHVLVDVPRVEEPLRDEEAHDRHGDAPNDVHQQGRRQVGIPPRIHRPRDVVDRHRDDRDELDLVRIQYLAVIHAA